MFIKAKPNDKLKIDEVPEEKPLAKRIKQELNDEIALANYLTKFTPEESIYKNEIVFIENLISNGELKKSTQMLTNLANMLPNSPRCVYLSALVIDRISEIEKSNPKLKKAVGIYKKLLTLDKLDKNLLYIAGKRLINRLQFLGKINDALKYNEYLVSKMPNNINLINDLGVNYLIGDRPKQAKAQFNKVLSTFDSNNSFALCHLGFIIKQFENKINESIDLFKACLLSKNKNVMDGRFFYHLGDALTRFNRTDEVSCSIFLRFLASFFF